jgi:hypothetical protein
MVLEHPSDSTSHPEMAIKICAAPILVPEAHVTQRWLLKSLKH